MEQFQEKLEERIKSHDHDIERMCNYHYQGFIDSVRELQQVGGDAASLKVNTTLSVSGSVLEVLTLTPFHQFLSSSA